MTSARPDLYVFSDAMQRSTISRLVLLSIVYFAAAASVIIQAGCGFKLRAAVDIPPQFNPIYVDAQDGSKVRRATLEHLQASEVRRAASAEDAKVVLRILRESRRTRVAAVDRDGKVVARELFLTVQFDAVNAQGKQLMKVATLDLSRTFENPDVEVLGKQLEAELIYEDLARDAADRILVRLRAALLR